MVHGCASQRFQSDPYRVLDVCDLIPTAVPWNFARVEHQVVAVEPTARAFSSDPKAFHWVANRESRCTMMLPFRHHSWSASTSRVTMNEVLPCYEPSTAMQHKQQKEGSTLCSGHSGSSIETSYYSAESRLSQSTPLSIVQPVEMRQESLSDFRRLLGESRQPSA